MDSHGIFITDDDRILIVDRDGHQVIGFDKHGRTLFTLGERDHPRYQAPFNHPTDIAVAPERRHVRVGRLREHPHPPVFGGTAN